MPQAEIAQAQVTQSGKGRQASEGALLSSIFLFKAQERGDGST